MTCEVCSVSSEADHRTWCGDDGRYHPDHQPSLKVAWVDGTGCMERALAIFLPSTNSVTGLFKQNKMHDTTMLHLPYIEIQLYLMIYCQQALSELQPEKGRIWKNYVEKGINQGEMSPRKKKRDGIEKGSLLG